MSVLSKVTTGRKLKPLALLLHAPHGIGKSTFAAESPNPVYIGSEENDELDVARFPRIETWNDLASQLQALRDETHDYKTLVIDTIDGLEQIAEKEILSQKGNKGKNMATADGSFGKAYINMANMFLNIRDNFLVPLRDKKGMNIVILAHSESRKHEDPMTNTSYDAYETAIHKKTKPIFEDWVSAILFANYYLVKAENSSGKEYAEGDGMRMIYTEERPSHAAKNRFDMPYEVEFTKNGTWARVRNMILDHFKSGNTEKADPKKKEVENKKKEEKKKVEAKDDLNELNDKIEDLLSKMPNDMKGIIEKSLSKAGTDEKELNRIVSKMEGMVQ